VVANREQNLPYGSKEPTWGEIMVDTVAAKFAKSRQALLDLSTRNRLLSLPNGASAKLINIYDELTSEIYRLLVTDGRNMSFLLGRSALGETKEESGDDESGISLPQLEEDEAKDSGNARAQVFSFARTPSAARFSMANRLCFDPLPWWWLSRQKTRRDPGRLQLKSPRDKGLSTSNRSFM
jgi:hypothetical protein